jgi:cell division protein FtsZ
VNDVPQTVVLIAAIVLGGLLLLRLLAQIPARIGRERRPETRAIRVIGVGGGGSNAVDWMVEARIPGVSFVAINTDAQALRRSRAGTRVRIGETITGGLGSGGDPEVGRKSAEEDEARIAQTVAGADLVFITAGLGGGTGSGAAPIVAADARVQGALTIAVVTKPFAFEGAQRRRIAEAAVAELAASVDAIITIPNDRVADVVADDASMLDAFRAVDDVLLQAVRGIIDLLNGSGLINLDFADVRAIMQGAGPALIGLGRGSGQNRAIDAARQAIASPLLEASVHGARRILFNISGPSDLRLREVQAAADEIRASADPDANVIFGASLNRRADEEVLITLIATGLDQSESARAPARAPQRRVVEAPKTIEPPAPIAASAELAKAPAPVEPPEPGAGPEPTKAPESTKAPEPAKAPEATMPGPEVGPAVNGGRRRQPRIDATPGREARVAQSQGVNESPNSRDRRSIVTPTDEGSDEGVDLEVPSFLRRRRST